MIMNDFRINLIFSVLPRVCKYVIVVSLFAFALLFFACLLGEPVRLPVTFLLFDLLLDLFQLDGGPGFTGVLDKAHGILFDGVELSWRINTKIRD